MLLFLISETHRKCQGASWKTAIFSDTSKKTYPSYPIPFSNYINSGDLAVDLRTRGLSSKSSSHKWSRVLWNMSLWDPYCGLALLYSQHSSLSKFSFAGSHLHTFYIPGQILNRVPSERFSAWHTPSLVVESMEYTLNKGCREEPGGDGPAESQPPPPPSVCVWKGVFPALNLDLPSDVNCSNEQAKRSGLSQLTGPTLAPQLCHSERFSQGPWHYLALVWGKPTAHSGGTRQQQHGTGKKRLKMRRNRSHAGKPDWPVLDDPVLMHSSCMTFTNTVSKCIPWLLPLWGKDTVTHCRLTLRITMHRNDLRPWQWYICISCCFYLFLKETGMGGESVL